MTNYYYTPDRVADNTIHADKIRAYWAARGHDVEVRVCRESGEIISDISPARTPRPVSSKKHYASTSILTTAERVERVICDEYGVTLAQLRGHSRRAEIVAARHEAWLRLREMTGLSYPGIGRRYNKDHATIMHGCQRAKERREAEEMGGI